MTELVVKNGMQEELRISIKNFVLSEKELTIALKNAQFLDHQFIKDSLYNITIENDKNNGIPEKLALYKSYLFIVTDDLVQQRDENGNLIEEKINVISSNQLLFTYL